MAVLKASSGNKAHWDHHIYGKINTSFDTLYDHKEVHVDWQSKIQVVNGDAMVRLEDVEALFCENEELRQTLFVQMSHAQECALMAMKQNAGHSTSSILSTIKTIERMTQNAMTGKDVFNFVYHQLALQYDVDFKECPKGKSKLQWLWSEGLLPLVSIHTRMLLEIIQHQMRSGPTGFKEWIKEVKQNTAKKSTPTAKKVTPF